MAVPLIAAGIAAGASLLGSGIQSYYNNKASEAEREDRKAAARQLKEQGQLTDAEYNQIINSIDEYYATRPTLGNADDVNAYREALSNELSKPEDYYAANVDPFTFDKTKEDFINPYYSRIIGDTAAQIQHSAAGAGLGRGTGAALNIAKGTAEKSDELYRTAMADYRDERNFAYQQYSDAIKNNQARLNAIRDTNQYRLGLQGDLSKDYITSQDQAFSDRMKAEQDRLAARQAYDTAMIGLY